MVCRVTSGYDHTTSQLRDSLVQFELSAECDEKTNRTTIVQYFIASVEFI